MSQRPCPTCGYPIEPILKGSPTVACPRCNTFYQAQADDRCSTSCLTCHKLAATESNTGGIHKLPDQLGDGAPSPRTPAANSTGKPAGYRVFDNF